MMAPSPQHYSWCFIMGHSVRETMIGLFDLLIIVACIWSNIPLGSVIRGQTRSGSWGVFFFSIFFALSKFLYASQLTLSYNSYQQGTVKSLTRDSFMAFKEFLICC